MTLAALANRLLLAAFLTFVPLAAAASAPDAESPLRVTVTVPPLVWLISEVAGPGVEVQHLIEVGDSPETFQPTDLQITAVARSALFFRVGVPAENGPWLRALEESGAIEVVDLRQGLALRAMDAHHHHHDHRGDHPWQEGKASAAAADSAPAPHGTDPHIWLSPRRLEIMAVTAARYLAKVDPPRTARFNERAAAVRARLRALDAALTERLAPVRGRAFLIFHPAWGYFADDYGLRQVAIEIEGKEPAEHELTHLARQVRALGIGTLFVQPQNHSTKLAPLARMLGARLETLDPLALDLPANLKLAAERLLVALLPQGQER